MSPIQTIETSALERDRRSVVTTSGDDETVFSAKVVVARRNTPAPWLRETIDKLRALATLEENWDSYGALPIKRTSIEHAINLVHELSFYVGVPAPAVGATPDGTAGLSWDGGPWSLDVDVTENGRYEYDYVNDDDPTLDIESVTRNPWELAALITAWG